ncbi:DUF2007 domain-containing protein [bacterium]|nr:MAG: DUF2007 domain-containing protein [bacterium]
MDNSEQDKLDHERLVTIYKTGNEAIISLIKSLLDEAGIKFLITNEGVQDLLGVGIIGTGFNPLTGPVHVKVMPEDEEYARELLKDINENTVAGDEESGT